MTLPYRSPQKASIGGIDTVGAEPMGGAHREPDQIIAGLADAVDAALAGLLNEDGGVLKARRRDKYLAMGKTGLA